MSWKTSSPSWGAHVCCSVLQCVAVRCCALQCVAVCCVLQFKQCVERMLMQCIQRIHHGHGCEPPHSLHRLLRGCGGKGVMSSDASALSSTNRSVYHIAYTFILTHTRLGIDTHTHTHTHTQRETHNPPSPRSPPPQHPRPHPHPTPTPTPTPTHTKRACVCMITNTHKHRTRGRGQKIGNIQSRSYDTSPRYLPSVFDGVCVCGWGEGCKAINSNKSSVCQSNHPRHMYTYIYIYTCTHICICIYRCIYIQMHEHIHEFKTRCCAETCLYVCIYSYTHKHVYVYTYIDTYIFIFRCIASVRKPPIRAGRNALCRSVLYI